MTQTQWHPIAPQAATRMSEARRQAHNAVHWMARIANSYVEPDAENRHVELDWNDEQSSLRTKELAPGLKLELRLANLELQFCEGGLPVPHILGFEDRTPAHVEAWFLVELLHRAIDRDRFSKELPYTAKDLMLGDHEEHRVDDYAGELAALQGWMRNAAAVLSAVRHDIGRDTGAEQYGRPIVCWPQPFQLGFEIALPSGSGAGAIRVGLSAGDNLRPEPYFFAGTIEQSLRGDLDADSILSVQRIAADQLSADDVMSFLRETTNAHRRRLAI